MSNLVGKKFGRLKVIRKAVYKKYGNFVWVCKCECGTITEKATCVLAQGRVLSCGCLQKENRIKHSNTIDGKASPLYTSWKNMRKRCLNEKDKAYHNYGGRGIRIHPPWIKSFETFRDYMLSLPDCPDNAEVPGDRAKLTIDRKNNDGNYEPGNMKWSTRKEQQVNRRQVRKIRINGALMPLREAVEKYAVVPFETVRGRLKWNWNYKEAFLTPVGTIRHSSTTQRG